MKTFWLKMCQRQVKPYRLHHDRPVEAFNNGIELETKLKKTQEIIKRAVSIYRPNEIMLCFNGGKDCTVLLDILANEPLLPKPLQAFYVKSPEPFKELEEFIHNCTQRYQMHLLSYEGLLKLATEQVKAERPQLRAMFLGCRRSDPGCSSLTELMPCDKDWPPLMRVFPLLEWSYHDIWSYLRMNKLPYCSLYDQGYTSLGERSSTGVNPNLLVYDEQKGQMIYRAAYELQDVRMERANRDEHGQEQKKKPH